MMKACRNRASITGRNADALPAKVMCHGYPTLRIASTYGWLPGARYTNLRDVRRFDRIGMIDIPWQDYDFRRHLAAVKSCRPFLTVACDIIDSDDLERTLDQARELGQWAENVIVVPKERALVGNIATLVPDGFLLGYSVPTRYGATTVPVEAFGARPVHLLGGRPDVQHRLAGRLNVFSLDCNRITLDAAFGDYFTGTCFRPHPTGGYYECIKSSLKSIEELWHRDSMSGPLPIAPRRGV